MTTNRRLPAEWSLQSGVLLTWPKPNSHWGDELAVVEPVFTAIASQISRHEKLVILCSDEDHRNHIVSRLEGIHVKSESISFYPVASNDIWIRDYGPVTVIEDRSPRLLDFTFNGWGKKYPADLDNRITHTLHEQGAFGSTPLESLGFVLEGGSIDSDGDGAVLTTTRCLLSPARNPGLSREQIETRLKESLGASRILWLENGYIAGDDTDGHIDMLARFCDKHTIAYTACDDPDDEHYIELQRMAEELAALRDSDGRPYTLVPLPLPEAKRNPDGKRLPASYANFLIINGAVLAPVYNDPADEIVLGRLRDCFPDREIIDIPCLPLITQYGSLHCATMQAGAGILR